MKLNLGCGKETKEGWINVDRVKELGVNVICNLEKPLPFKDNYFNEVYASYILEHIQNLEALMEEIYRICKNGAIINIKVPYFASASAFNDVAHYHYFSLKTFNTFQPNNYNCYSKKAKFKILKKEIKITRKNWIINLPIEFIVNHIQWFYERFLCFILPFQVIYFKLEVIK